MLTVIHGGYSPPIDRSGIYLNGYIRTLETIKLNPGNKDAIRRAVFYGVHFVNSYKNQEPEMADALWDLIEYTNLCIGRLTPREFITIFPITKTYDGDRWQSKDYFYTMNAMKEFGLDAVIGDKVHELLWDYMNIKVQIFTVNTLSLMDRIRRAEGKRGMLEEFFGDAVQTYHKVNDTKGRGFMVNAKTGERHKVTKRIPRYLKLVKEDKNGHSF